LSEAAWTEFLCDGSRIRSIHAYGRRDDRDDIEHLEEVGSVKLAPVEIAHPPDERTGRMRLKSELPPIFEKQKWARRRRLTLIDFHLFWEGEITKSRVKNFFEASDNTVRGDFRFYVEVINGKMYLDEAENRYRATHDFRPILIEPDSDDYLYYLSQETDALDRVLNHADRVLCGDLVYLPPLIQRIRKIDPTALQLILKAIREDLDLNVGYESPNSPGTKDFWIGPHSLTHDGFRWACRAYRYDYGRFGDLVLDRVTAVDDLRLRDRHTKTEDVEWNTEFAVIIGPNPDLDEAARKHIEQQYGMIDGQIAITVKRAAIPYFLKRYQIEEKSSKKAPHQEPIVVLNRNEVTEALPPYMRIPPEFNP
jgi:hypothetical protein